MATDTKTYRRDKNLTQEYVKHLFDYSDGMLIRRIQKGKIGKVGTVAGAVNSTGRSQIGIDGVYYLAHRIVYLWHHGNVPEFIDHIDGNPLNNRIENLRPATKLQNSWNMKTSANSTSGVKNVKWHKQSSKWDVTISHNKERKTIGRFKHFDDAVSAAIAARKLLHGDYANHGN